MQPGDRVGPPPHGHAAPLGRELRMMRGLFGDGADGIGECERADEVGEGVHALELADASAIDDTPVGNLAQEGASIHVTDGRCARATGDAPLVGERGHFGSEASLPPTPQFDFSTSWNTTWTWSAVVLPMSTMALVIAAVTSRFC